nr:MAG TPA: hypothetical protein [Caudoviricetes sp.]
MDYSYYDYLEQHGGEIRYYSDRERIPNDLKGTLIIAKEINSTSTYGLSIYGNNVSDVPDNYYFSFISNSDLYNEMVFSTDEQFDIAYSDKYLIYNKGNSYLIKDGNSAPSSDWNLLQGFMGGSKINLNNGIVVRRHFN